MRNPEYITSPANPLLKEIRKAISRGDLMENGCCVAETFHLLDEALRSKCRVVAVVAAESVRDAVEERVADREDVRMVLVPDKLLDAGTQGVVALVEPSNVCARQDVHPVSLIIDGVQDPGNLGTIFRSAEAFGASCLLLMKGTVNPFNPKVIRASAGSIFRVHFKWRLDAQSLIEVMRQQDGNIYAAVPDGGCLLADADLKRSCSIIIGSEGQGVSPTLRAVARDLTIPTNGVESLNAAMSAAIILYEVQRQRTSA